MIVYRCNNCKTDDILIQGYLNWNPLTEEYTVEMTDNIAYCKNCKDHVEIIEESLYSDREERVSEFKDIISLQF